MTDQLDDFLIMVDFNCLPIYKSVGRNYRAHSTCNGSPGKLSISTRLEAYDAI